MKRVSVNKGVQLDYGRLKEHDPEHFNSVNFCQAIFLVQYALNGKKSLV
jgi:hypothetical protein